MFFWSMVRVYRLLLIVVTVLLSFSKAFAMLEDKENVQPSPLQKKKIGSLEGDTFQSPLKKTIPIFQPLLEASPTTAERKFWSPIRREMVFEAYPYNNQQFKKFPISTPKVREIYRKHDHGNFFKIIRFKGKKTFQADHLFNPEALVLNESGDWETNLERMKQGLAPIGHKGIASESDRRLLDADHILKKQKNFRIDLQHVTQKDTGADEDPICEMTHAAHLGLNARLIIKYDSKVKEVHILSSSLEKQEAEILLGSDQFMVTNVLHFRKGLSLIDRNAFGTWRETYWKKRAAKIEKDHFNKKLPHRIVKALLFDSPKKHSHEYDDENKAI
ncbi:MAG: HNH/ENDO VII family nuclease [Alphaproteobacteria bacterium]|nr:HNH/ENDO VII family nuclease [Alphaproteobacteria bacterium]